MAVYTLTELLEADVSSLLSEALSGQVESVLSDQTVVLARDSALSRALSVVSRVGIPNVLVSHTVC